MGSTPHGREFQAGVKKIPSTVARQSTVLRSGPRLWSLSHGLWYHCVWVEQGFRGFHRNHCVFEGGIPCFQKVLLIDHVVVCGAGLVLRFYMSSFVGRCHRLCLGS